MLKYIFVSFVALGMFAGLSSDEPAEVPVEVKKTIKLTTKHLPIQRYFAEDDDDTNLYVFNHAVLVRRDTALKARVDITPTEDDVVITDGIRLRLLLARMKAMNRYDEVHGVDKV